MIQQLIEWMEKEIKNPLCPDSTYLAYKMVIMKAKSLQATEQCKWAVVDKSATFNSKEDAEQHFDVTFCNNQFHTIVKIIEP
jgi:hypothetical protein